MKYHCETVIGLPRERVIALFDDPTNLVKWQPELLKFEPVEGIPGQEGAKAKLTYRIGKRELEMIETVTLRELPARFDAIYETRGVFNRVSNWFIDHETTTVWAVESEFRFGGAMAALSLFMWGTFRKQTQRFMHQFKTFAEEQGS